MSRKIRFHLAVLVFLTASVVTAQSQRSPETDASRFILDSAQATMPQRAIADHSPGASSDAIPLRNWEVKMPAADEGTLAGRIASQAVPSLQSHFVAIAPCRVVDTRNANGPWGGPKLVANVARTFDIINNPACPGIPANSSAYSVNLTIFAPEAPGFLTAWNTGGSQPGVSSLNFTTGQTVPNAAIVPAGTSAQIDVFSVANTHLIIDINGYFVEAGVAKHPIAYAVVNSNGTLLANTPNVTGCPWNATLSRYECTISGETYHFASYVTNATVIGGSSSRFVSTDSISGTLIVSFHDAAGTAVQSIFEFVTYKP